MDKKSIQLGRLLRYTHFGKLAWQYDPDSRLNLTTPHCFLFLHLAQEEGLCLDAAQHVSHKRIENSHGVVGNANVYELVVVNQERQEKRRNLIHERGLLSSKSKKIAQKFRFTQQTWMDLFQDLVNVYTVALFFFAPCASLHHGVDVVCCCQPCCCCCQSCLFF